jgi:hypothetical protein
MGPICPQTRCVNHRHLHAVYFHIVWLNLAGTGFQWVSSQIISLQKILYKLEGYEYTLDIT